MDPARLAASVPMDLYLRHLGLPGGAALDGRAAALAESAADWYRAHGDPWVHAVVRRVLAIEGDRVTLESGAALTSAIISAGLRETAVHAVAIVAASAGARADEEVDRLWKDGRPDEAMFLSSLAVAVAEHLRDSASSAMAADEARAGVTALPRYAPGYEGWGLADQAALVAALDDRGPLHVLPSGGLLPQKSTVAAIGLTRRHDLVVDTGGFWFRRLEDGAAPSKALYAFPERALEKWSRERLTLTSPASGRMLARFRFDGKTCSSIGRPLAFDYDVELERDGAAGHRIVAGRCAPSAGDSGYRATCEFMANPEDFLAAVREAPPFLGENLDEALHWSPFESPSGCLCTAANRSHKWKIVCQTIHFAVSRLDRKGSGHD